MRSIGNLFKGLGLFFIAIILAILVLPLGFVWSLLASFFGLKIFEAIDKIGKFFLNIAYSIDQLGNVVCYEMLNDFFINNYGYRFGDADETISSVLGKNKQMDTLTNLGKALDWILHILDENHTIKSIEK